MAKDMKSVRSMTDAGTNVPASKQELHEKLQEALPFFNPGIVAIISILAQDANRWNPLAKGSGVVIAGEDGFAVTLPTMQTVLAEHGYSRGRHYWELDVLSLAVGGWVGVAEAGVATNTWLHSTGYAVRGDPDGGSAYPFAKGTSLERQVPCFKPGDGVGLLLDLGADGATGAGAQRKLEYFLNGKSQGVTHSGAHLPSSGPLFPALGGWGPSAQFRARFDLPCPR